jgi:replicative DNA helicase
MGCASEEPDPEKAWDTIADMATRAMSARGGEVGRSASDGIVAMMEAVGNMGTGLYGLSTGFQTIDSAIGGLAPGDVSVLAGATGTGKTALALQVAYHVSLGNPVLYFSGEMLDEDLWLRNTCRLAEVSLADLRREKTTDSVAEMVRKAAEASADSQMRIVCSDLSISSVVAKIQKFHADYGPGLVVIDHLDHVTAEAEGRVQQIADIMRALKAAALSCELPVIVVSQFNRNFDATHRPTMFNLKGGSSIEQYADSIWLLSKAKDPGGMWMRVQIEKNRRGPVGDIRMTWNPRFTSFTDGQLLGDWA